MKHHEWIEANKKGISVLEIGHFSEKIFKDMIEATLLNKEMKIILSKEQNGYKSV
jgi:putative NIF3 family GTP cyclohydrolase 1 type 2